ncbi:MAG: DUF3850 domain-containing protein [Lachnospiraceae bacterium]|nr:DUF3850 domain-containing protein [Lachnospiraceae bacterium]
MIHTLKCLPEFFEESAACRKNFESRINDRDYSVGDYLALNEYTEKDGYTGRAALFEITYIFDDPKFVKEGFVIMAIDLCKVSPAATVGGEEKTILDSMNDFSSFKKASESI